MAITYTIEREQATNRGFKSIFVLMTNDTPSLAYRRFEAALVPDSVVAADYLTAAYPDPQAMWNAGTALTTRQGYVLAFQQQRRVIARAFYTFAEGFRTATVPPTLAQYRSTLGSTLAIINTLPAAFITELSQERAGLALVDPNITPPASWTLAQCQGWHTLLSGWLGRTMAAVAIAAYQDLD